MLLYTQCLVWYEGHRNWQDEGQERVLRAGEIKGEVSVDRVSLWKI